MGSASTALSNTGTAITQATQNAQKAAADTVKRATDAAGNLRDTVAGKINELAENGINFREEQL